MRHLFVVGCLVAGVLASSTSAQASVISFGSHTVAVGDTFDVDVRVDPDPGETLSLFAFAFSYGFDATVLSLNSITEGALFASLGGSIFDTTPVGGIPTVTDILLFDTATGPGVLATLSFTVLTAGDPLFTLFDTALVNDLGFVDHTLNAGTISVEPAPVPEPSTLGLFGLGIVSLARHLRRRPAVH